MSGGRKRMKRPKAGDDAPPAEPGELWFFLYRDGNEEQLRKRQAEYGNLLAEMLGDGVKREDSREERP